MYHEVPPLLAGIQGLSLLSNPHLLREPGIAELAQAVLHCEAVVQQLLKTQGRTTSLGMLDMLVLSPYHR